MRKSKVFSISGISSKKIHQEHVDRENNVKETKGNEEAVGVVMLQKASVIKMTGRRNI